MKKDLRQISLFLLMMAGLAIIAAAGMTLTADKNPFAIIIPAIAVAVLFMFAVAGNSPLGQAGFAALTADRNTPRRDGQQISLGVAATKKIFAGSLVMKTAAGYATPGAAATLGTAIGIGRSNEDQDNTSGADGAINALIDAYGCYRFANSAAGDAVTIADIGRPCYIVDDQTVARTSNNGARCTAGVVYDVDSSGVWIDFSRNVLPGLAQRDVVALADAAATLTADQLINKGLFTITPTAGRALTLDTAALLVAGAPGCKAGDTFEFTVVCLAAFAATITTAAGLTLVGNMAVNNQSGVFIGRFTNVGAGTEAVTIYRKA